MVTQWERRTECELVDMVPLGVRAMTLGERNSLVNDQITRTFREPSKASLIHFSLLKQPECKGGDTNSFKSAPPKGWGLSLLGGGEPTFLPVS